MIALFIYLSAQVRANDGTYLLFSIGRSPLLASTAGLMGPWRRVPFTSCNNPAPLVVPHREEIYVYCHGGPDPQVCTLLPRTYDTFSLLLMMCVAPALGIVCGHGLDTPLGLRCLACRDQQLRRYTRWWERSIWPSSRVRNRTFAIHAQELRSCVT
eukprot:COSAG01_NODE_3864_length_5615_cov_20.982777_3_plen_156_part_00